MSDTTEQSNDPFYDESLWEEEPSIDDDYVPSYVVDPYDNE